MFKKIFIPIYLIINELLKQIRISFIIGSKLAFFNLNQFFSPLIGLWNNTQNTIIYFSLKTVISYFIGFSFTFYLPTLGSALYLSSSKLLKILIPLFCIFAFILNPIGKTIFLYSFFWFIPIIIAIFEPKYIFFKFLGSTFVAHGIGTIIWLYLGKFPVDSIYSLSTIVIFERITFALGMLLIYKITFLIYNFINSKDLKYISNGANI